MYEQEKKGASGGPADAQRPPMKSAHRPPMKKICVYCGSKPGKRAGYLTAADELGNELVRQGIGLVYGGGRTGLMGRIADCVVKNGGEATGIIPRSLTHKEAPHEGLSALKIVGSMHERKALMAELSDGFIAMPGGLGTLEELFEALAWAQLGFHQKPCAVFNACGYYDNLAVLLDQAVAEGFVKPTHRGLMIMDDDPARLLQRMGQFVPAQP